MTRIAVIGNAGGGKSTLCRALSEASGLPYYPVDLFLWQPGWTLASRDDFDAAHDAILHKEKWILDGLGPLECIERRLEAADTIVFIDFPLWRHIWWATKRQAMSFIRAQPDTPEGCAMWRITFQIYYTILRLDWALLPELLDAVERHSGDKDVFHIRSPGALREFKETYA